MRAALGVGGLAAISALAAAIVAPPRPDTVVLAAPAAVDPNAVAQNQAPTDPGPAATPVQVQRQVKYVQLLPGQTPPPGATVIPAAAPTPITVVVTVPGGGGGGTSVSKPVAKPTPIIIKTTQSGKVVP